MLALRKLLFILVASCILNTCVNSFLYPNNERDRNEAMLPRVDSNDQKARLPEQIVLNLTMASETIRLILKRNRNIPTDTPVIVARNGTYSNWTEGSKEFSAYYDRDSSASIVIEMKKKNNIKTKRFSGILSHKGKFYSMYPLESRHLFNSGSSRHDEFLVDIEGVDHMMKLEDAKFEFHEVIKKDSRNQNRKEKFAAGDRRKRPSGFQRYVVEMYIFTDHALYSRWYRQSKAKDPKGRHHDAVENLRYYFVHVANGVDMRYSTIRRPDFSINVRLVGLYIAATPRDSIWTERSDFTTNYKSEKYVKHEKALSAFEEWLPNKILELKVTFDQATLFTGSRLYNGSHCSRGEPCALSGLANMRSICQLNGPKAKAASINNELGIYASIQTAAHELGHNLGVEHDGDTNKCSGNSQYVMAPGPSTLTPDIFKNSFTFSSCSIDQVRDYLASVTMRGKGNCLLVASSAPTVVVPPNFAAFPGMQYTADQQCQNSHGSSSYYCAGGSKVETICERMECWVPRLNNCASYSEQRAYDGTKCGNRKWCMNGKCLKDSRASSTPDTCIFGDFKAPVAFDSKSKMTCAEMGRLLPYRCYNRWVADDCCETCAKIRDKTKSPGCEYGDKASWCATKTMSAAACRYGNTNTVCCARCKKYLNKAAAKAGD